MGFMDYFDAFSGGGGGFGDDWGFGGSSWNNKDDWKNVLGQIGGGGFNFGPSEDNYRTQDFNPRARSNPQFTPNNYISPTRPDSGYLDFLDIDAEDIGKIREAYSRPTGSSQLVEDYVNRMPKQQDYKPSFWRKLGTGLAAGGGVDYRTLNDIYYEPYNQQYKAWKDEGQFLDDRVRLIEADRNREINAIKLGIQEKRRGQQQEWQNFYKDLNYDLGLDRLNRTDENQDLDRGVREQRNRILQDQANKRLGLSEDRYNLSRERYENPNYKPRDLNDPSQNLADQKAAEQLAFKQAMTMREFAPLIEYYNSGGRNFREFVQQNPHLAGLLNNFRMFMQQESQRIMARRGGR